MVTRTDTFAATGSEQSWTAPSDINSDVTVLVLGAGGVDAAASGDQASAATTGAPGGKATGDRSVAAGDTLIIVVGTSDGWPNGGSGALIEADTATADSGSGAGVSRVELSDGTVIIAAGGGAGGSAAGVSGSDTSNEAAAGAPGQGGGTGGDGQDVSVAGQTLTGGAGGATTGAGQDAASASDADGAAAATGGGGGGQAGGEIGDVYASLSSFDGAGDAGAAGAGAGDGTLSGVTNASSTVGGGNTGDAEIELTYETPLRAATNLSVDNRTATSLTVGWTVNEDHPDAQQRVEFKASDASTWQVYSQGLALSVTEETIDGLLHGEKYDTRVITYTDSESVVDE